MSAIFCSALRSCAAFRVADREVTLIPPYSNTGSIWSSRVGSDFTEQQRRADERRSTEVASVAAPGGQTTPLSLGSRVVCHPRSENEVPRRTGSGGAAVDGHAGGFGGFVGTEV